MLVYTGRYTVYMYNNNILECTRSNFFLFHGDILVTPKTNVLIGRTRNLVLELAKPKYNYTLVLTGDIRDKLKDKVVKKFSKKREALKKIIKNRSLPLEERFNAQLKLAKLPRNSAKNRIRNRCEITGRPHGVYRKLRISRIALRDLASQGKIPGMTKSSW